MNETLQAIFDRRSIRRFHPDPVTEDQLELLKQVALASPSANDRQPWHFHFIMDPQRIRAIDEAALETFRATGQQALLDRLTTRGGGIFYGAPLVVFLSLPRDEMSLLDAGIAVENLAIAAQSMGLGSCIVGLARAAFSGAKAEEMAALIDMPATRDFATSIAIGHAAMTKEAHIQHAEKVTVIR